jgi:dTDP-4-dehydrorhamnose 3,5-epimerase
VKNVPRDVGFLSEVFRVDWGLGAPGVDQVFQNTLLPRAISAWHAHAATTDRLFAVYGVVKVVLFDARVGSTTFGRINELRIGVVRPALVVVPPRVWHGLQNVSEGPAVLLNIVDRAYSYEAPDHWRVPADSPAVPYRFET